MSEVEQAIMNEREACAKLLEELAQERRKQSALFTIRERATLYKEIADALDRSAMFIRERESITV